MKYLDNFLQQEIRYAYKNLVIANAAYQVICDCIETYKLDTCNDNLSYNIELGKIYFQDLIKDFEQYLKLEY